MSEIGGIDGILRNAMCGKQKNHVPAAIAVAFRTLEWQATVISGLFDANGDALVPGRPLSQLETGVYHAALERLRLYLNGEMRDDAPAPETVFVDSGMARKLRRLMAEVERENAAAQRAAVGPNPRDAEPPPPEA